jgi:cell division protein FtsN
MAKDYAPKQKVMKMRAAYGKRKSKRPRRHIWLTILLLIFLLAGSLNYLNKQHKSNSHPLKVLTVKKSATVSKLSPAVATQKIIAKPIAPIAPPANEPKFDFYTILPKDKVPSTPAETANKNSPASQQFVLHVKNLATAEDADHLKAELSLLGFDVTIKTINFQNKISYQLLVGPYVTREAALADQKRLFENKFPSNLESVPVTTP